MDISKFWRALVVIAATITIAIPSSSALAQDGQQRRIGGITVHGHWIIEVRDPNGALAKRREFENALLQGTANGDAALAGFLAGSQSVGRWAIVIPGACVSPGAAASPANCFITEPAFSTVSLGDTYFPNATIGLSADQRKLVLTGHATAQRSAAIAAVQTVIEHCSSNVSPTACANATGINPFTQAFLSTPMNVVAGQVVQVTVTFSFS